MKNTTCPYCGVGCGVSVTDGVVSGDVTHPANGGKLCVKGSTLAQTLDDSNRLTVPLIKNQPASWDEALTQVAAGFKATIAQYGPDSVAIYGSGQFLTEDYYVANKLMKGFLGSANIDTNSRLCMASTVAGHVRAFGEDVVPGAYADIEAADLLVFVGANAAWCHPVLFERAQAARAARGTKIVVIDPRRTASAALADLHLQLAPDADVLLFSRLLTEILIRGAHNEAYIAAHTSGFDETIAAARQATGDTGIADAALKTFFDWFCGTEKTVTFFSQGVNQSACGVDKVNAIINVHLATGRIGRPGMGPFSLTGQPNAMGGREVGGLANQLAAHMWLENAADRALVAEFWGAKNIATEPGLKAVDMFDAVLSGKIKAIFIAATNPAESLPHSASVRAALAACPLVVAADCWPTETTRLADIVLPAAGWSEKDGTVTNSERCISRQRAFRAPPGEAKPDWWIFTQLAHRLGFGAAFAYQKPADVFREHAALTGYQNHGARRFDISHLSGISDTEYDQLAPFQWGAERFFADGKFSTADGKARFVPVQAAAPAQRDAAYPLTLNTGRLRDQWHTMTRTGFVPALMAGDAEAFVSLAPADAEEIEDGQLVRVTTAQGSLVLPARISLGQRQGDVFAAMHWTEAHQAAGTINRLVGQARDAISGQPALKHERAAVTPLPTLWHGILVSRFAPAMAEEIYAARVPLEGGLQRMTLAGYHPLDHGEALSAWGLRLCGAAPDAERVEFFDAKRAIYRLGVFAGETCVAALFIHGEKSRLPAASYVVAFLQAERHEDRTILLRGSTAPAPLREKTICVCHNVTETVIRDHIRAGIGSIAALGAVCRAGTNCGSCKGELAELITQNQREMAL
jgi:assimilatory nitrate reductase catalytic subunit